MDFNRRPADHAQANPSAKPGPSIIGADLVVTGAVSTTGEIHLDGKILGEVHGAQLFIGDAGRVEGDIFAEHVAVRGELVGSASARTVVVTSTGRVDGNLLVENLTLEPGGHFEGHCGHVDSHSQGFATKAAGNPKSATPEPVEPTSVRLT